MTVRQLERWRSAGAIPRARRRALGRGRGTTSAYDDDQVAYIIEIAARSARHRELWRVVLWASFDGVSVPEPCLRWAYECLANRLGTPDDLTPEQAAERDARQHLDKGWRDPLRTAIRRAYRTLRREGHFADDARNGRTQTVHTATNSRDETPSLASFERHLLTSIYHAARTGEPLDDRTVKEIMKMIHFNRDIELEDRHEVDEWILAEFPLVNESISADRLVDAARNAPVELFYIGAMLARGDGQISEAMPPLHGYPSHDLVAIPLATVLAHKHTLEMELSGDKDEPVELRYDEVLDWFYRIAEKEGIDITPERVKTMLRGIPT